jgi:hypothetical protein
MVTVTTDEVKKVFEDLVSEKITRKEAEKWAWKLCDAEDNQELEYYPKNKEDIIWKAITYLCGVDLQIDEGVYFHSIELIKESFEEKWKNLLE